MRVVGVSVPDVSDWNHVAPTGKWSQFFAALSRRFDVIDVVSPTLSRRDHLLSLAGGFRPSRSSWRPRVGFSESLRDKRSEAVQRELARTDGPYDLIMQLQTLCRPGHGHAQVPYAIYTDNTMALTQRLYPAGANLSPEAALRWCRFEADVCRSATAVFCFSEFARRSVIEDYGCPPERVVAVGAGANQQLSSLDDKDYSAPRALFVGTDFTRKGGLVLLEAWKAVSRRLPGAELVIAGPRRDPRRGRHPGVSWVGRVDRRTLAELYESATIFVLPSLFEPWGHVFFEAMGHGLSCIGTSCCAMPEIIDEGVTGQLVAPGQAEPLASALIEALADPTRSAARGHAAHAKVLRGNAWSDVADRVAAHLY